MLLNAKALVVVLLCAIAVFAFARPLFLRFTAPGDYALRRNVWFILTIAAFLSPSFWIYVMVAMPVMAWAGYRDSNPTALYLFLYFVIPPVFIPIPTVLINQLFALSNARMMSFLILVPAVWRWLASLQRGERIRLNGLDYTLLAYGLLQLALFIPYESSTNTMRRGFLFLVDTYLVYFAFSRMIRDRHQLADTMGGLCLAAALFAPMAIFESLRGWLLYTGVSDVFGNANIFAWIFRGGSLRAQAATGHSITLGYIVALAIGFWMYLRETQPSKKVNTAFFLLLWLAMFFTYARGPWVMGVLLVVVAVALGSRNAVQMMKIAVVPSMVVLAILVSPFGSKFIDLLPFVGSAGAETITQRQALAETSWRLVQQNPWFGNPFVLLQMEDLRTGDQIIDLVNGYAQVALFYGLVGLALFLAVFLGSLHKAYATFRQARVAGDDAMVWLGASLIACLIASLFVMATSGQLYLQWITAALLVAYAGMQVVERPAPETAVVTRAGGFRPRRAATP
jgi:hypothetical protein